jgi:hypothetical protein
MRKIVRLKEEERDLLMGLLGDADKANREGMYQAVPDSTVMREHLRRNRIIHSLFLKLTRG